MNAFDHFAEIASRQPQHPALETVDVANPHNQPLWTYEMLHNRALQLAWILHEKADVRPGNIVALDLGRRPEHIAAILAVWALDAVFVPLDEGSPEERRQEIIAQSGAHVVLCWSSKHASAWSPTVRTLALCGLSWNGERLQRNAALHPEAYRIFTSGSSGKPKGVRVGHRGLVPMLRAQIEAFGMQPRSRSLCVLSMSFDASLSDIGCALLSGATLILHPTLNAESILDLPKTLKSYDVTHIDIPPAVLRILHPQDFPTCVQTLIVGGEPCPPHTLRLWARSFTVINVYGPTEATICTSLVHCDPNTWDAPHIGAPLPGVKYLVLDLETQDELHTPHSQGELVILGDQVALGYVDPNTTHEKRFTTYHHTPAYFTRDLVTIDSQNRLIFAGRVDRQLKLNGRLIAPEEIEAQALTHPHVQRAAVFTTSNARPALAVSPANIHPDNLRSHLARLIPPWMIPQTILTLPSLPHTHAGKVDTQRLRNTLLHTPNPNTPNTQNPTLQHILSILTPLLDHTPTPDTLLRQSLDSLSLLHFIALLHAAHLPLHLEHFNAQTTPQTLAFHLQNHTPTLPPHTSAQHLRSLLPDLHTKTLPPPSLPHPTPPNTQSPTLLLTGATGFLGSHLLTDLHTTLPPTQPIALLIRAHTPQHARQRLQHTLQRWNLPNDILHSKRPLHILCGDLSKPLLDLPPQTYADLTASLHTLVHCAARVHILEDATSLWAPNVLSTVHIAQLALACKHPQPTRLFAASTLSVFVSAEQHTQPHSPSSTFVALESDDLTNTQRVFGGYAQTKWLSEVFLRTLPHPKNLSIHHLRYGLLTAHTQHHINPPNDLLSLTLQGLTQLQHIPHPLPSHICVDITPIDYAARTTAAAITHSNPSETLHINAPNPTSIVLLRDALHACNIPLHPTSPERFASLLHDHLSTPSSSTSATLLSLCRLLPKGHTSSFQALRTGDLFQSTYMHFDTHNTTALLQRENLPECPQVGVSYLVELIKNLG